jgi:hypothetical protein
MTRFRDEIPPDEYQINMLAARAAEIEAQHPDYAKLMRRLEKKLLAVDGHAVVWMPEKDVQILVERGKRLPRMPIEVIKGRTSRCHWNIAEIWDNPEKFGIDSGFSIVVGYVLDVDSPVWRQHTWGLTGDGRLIETTKPRAVYWGVELPRDYAEAWIADRRTFCRDPDDVDRPEGAGPGSVGLSITGIHVSGAHRRSAGRGYPPAKILSRGPGNADAV